MNRGSGIPVSLRACAWFRFNEAPIHESGKSDRTRRRPRIGRELQ